MGSKIIQNDTLQITREQGFPMELAYEQHKATPLKAEDFAERIFAFHGKSGIRNYQQSPTRCFLVENIGNKWLYWGLVQVLEVTHDYVNQTTSGKFKITYLYPPEDMKKAFDLIDHREEESYL